MNKKIIKKDTTNSKEKFKKRELYIIFALLTLISILWTIITTSIGFLGASVDKHMLINVLAYGSPLSIKYYFGKWSWIFYFTNIANIIFFIVTFIRIFYRKGIWNDRAQVVIASYMIIVGIMYWVAIAPMEFKSKINDSMLGPDWLIMFILKNILIHGMTVIFAIVLIIVGIDRKNVQIFPTSLYALSFPLAYYAMAWGLYLYTAQVSPNNNPGYIYQFLNFYYPYGIHANIYTIVGINIGFFVAILGIFFSVFLLVSLKSRTKMVEKMSSTQILKIEDDLKDNSTIRRAKKDTRKSAASKVKKTKTKAPIANNKNTIKKYFIQKSTKTNGWELKKMYGKRATYIAKRKKDVKEYYEKYLRSNKNTILIEKGMHGKIKSVKKRNAKK